MPTYSIIPNATDQISQSQSQIQTNFASIKSLVDINHVDFSDGVNFGKHYAVTFPVQLAANLPTFLSGEVALYNMLPTANPTTGVDELFINKIVSGGAAVQIPMTASILSTSNAPATFSNGWTYLPSGILAKWGQASGAMFEGGASASKGVVTFPVLSNVPVFKGVFQIMLGQIWTVNRTSAGSNGFALNAMTTTTFTVTWSGNNSTGSIVNYLAIGY